MTWVLSRQVPTQVSTQVGDLTTTCSGHWATLEAASDQFSQVILREPAAIKKLIAIQLVCKKSHVALSGHGEKPKHKPPLRASLLFIAGTSWSSLMEYQMLFLEHDN